MMGQVDGKVALVTGGASGIGEACALTLAREGARVVISDIDDARGKALTAKIGGGAIYLNQDVVSEPRWIEVVAEIEKQCGKLDVLVSNAGIGIATPILDMSLEDWQRQQSINLDGVFLSVKHSVPLMRKSGGGSIILMSSVAGLRGAPGLAAYAATKGGVRLFGKSVALELTAEKIRVNTMHPGIIATPIWGKIPTGARGMGHNAPVDPYERAKMAVPLGMAGEAQDIANGVLWLASDASRYVTGMEMVIDGGMMAGNPWRRL
ncbi:MAG: glucose 1-dehydrogenase [Alphaproteobacteria bacterium]|nr:glucose 1-dehydrogenase [Alphaproteobacteria bacterium]